MAKRNGGLPAHKVASHLGVMLVVSAVLGVVVSGLAIPFAGVLGFTARNVAESIEELPQELETELLPQRTVIQDEAGNTIATVYDQNRVNVSLAQISRIMVKAIVSIEDYRFYQHGALDLKGTLRALFTNQAADGVVQGGSSITQQLVKLTLVNQADTEEEEEAATADTYARKLRELRYAIALEKRYSKDWILERYLNTAYFGDGAYGIQAAAQHYFDVNAKDLDLPQSAMLAGIVQSPGAFDPTENPDRSRERRNVVLDRMAELSVISEKTAEKTKRMPLDLHVQPKSNGCSNSGAQFFCEYVIAYLKKDPALGDNPKDRWELIQNGGLTITTTIDMRMQQAAQQSVGANVYKQDGAIGALALVEPGTGEVKGLAQSRPLGKDEQFGETYLNYTVPKEYGKANGFQPGSTFKAFVLAAAVNQGIPLNRTIPAPGTISVAENSFETCDGPYSNPAIWSPSNSTSASAAPDLYEGTQKSVNTFFVRLEQMTGICEPWQLARAMGIKIGPEWQKPSFTLGVSDVSPLEMAEAYGTFAARGRHCDSRPVTKIEDTQGNVLKEYQPACQQVLPSAVADAVNDVLEGVLAPGGFGDDLYPGQAAAGKTGTTSDNKAVWFVGYTPNLAGAATVAGVNEVGQPETLEGKSIGGFVRYGTAGSTTAGPIWGQAFGAIAPFLPDESFTDPSTTDIAGVLTAVPSVAGMSEDGATQTLETAGFTVENGGYVDSGYAEGTVAYTSPGAGAMFGSGDTVTIYISDGSPPPPPPRNNGGGNGGRGGGNGGGNGNGGGGR
ncbi:MAG TPA: transglycosylase domain-containing protein [Nocardioides sp.]|nr:transglycosylase domain-containing protein [Nocardioides sp.]